MSLNPKLYAILHKQICDNATECPAKIACEEESMKAGRNPAIYIDNKKKISINRANCIGCASCIKQCGLFRIVSRYTEQKYQEEFDNDPRNEIMKEPVERFGCDIIDINYKLQSLDNVKEYISSSISEKINILELVVNTHVICPFQAIAVDTIKSFFSILGDYRKLVIDFWDDSTLSLINNIFSINQFPAIVLLKDGKIYGDPILTEYRVTDEKERALLFAKLKDEFEYRVGI